MSEVWAAAIAAGGAMYSAKEQKDAADDARKDSKAATRDEARYSAALSAFNAEQDDYYSQLGRSRKQRGLDNFRQFNTVKDYAPSYAGNDTTIVMPSNKPNIDMVMKEQGINEQQEQAKAKRSLLDKLGNPLGL